MKVLLIKDVYKLGRAGDVKKVADGFGRNFLLPQGFAVLATLGALKQADWIRSQATVRRAELNNEMGGIAEKINGLVLTFASKAGETGKLYGSITSQMIAEAINNKAGINLDRRAVETQPVRTLGEHKARVRLTMDLVPEIKIIVHREGEVVDIPAVQAAPAVPAVVVEKPAAVVEETPAAVVEETPAAVVEETPAAIAEETPAVVVETPATAPEKIEAVESTEADAAA